MQRTLQPYSMLPTDPKNTNAMFSDLAGTSTLDPLALVPLPTPMGAASFNVQPWSFNALISVKLLNTRVVCLG